MTPRGIRNNNPGNIEAGEDWRGLADRSEFTAAQLTETRFAVFSRPWWGIRAMARILTIYQAKHELYTVRSMIARWAPEGENHTAAYADYVATKMGVDPDQRFAMSDAGLAERMVAAMIKFENGVQPYGWEIRAGLILAGIEPGSTVHEAVH